MAEDNAESGAGYMEGQLLIAMPSMGDSRFAKAVIYLCAHSAEGAVGLVVNKLIDTLTFPELLEHMDIGSDDITSDLPVHFGGPVESGRGFVLHSAEFEQEGTLVVDGGIALTATVDILQELAKGDGPKKSLLALGYSGWGPGQLESEIQDNAWLNVGADDALVFGLTQETKWENALRKLGIDQAMLSASGGRA